MARIVRCLKIGDSIYIVIPAPVVRQLALIPGDVLLLECDGRQIYAAPLQIKDLLASVRKDRPELKLGKNDKG